jgi:hypothetical protein
MLRSLNAWKLICPVMILCAGSLFFQNTALTKGFIDDANKPTAKAQVMVLGMYHFASRKDVYNMETDDVMSPKRQAEIADLIVHLREFKPTKIVIEAPYGDTKQNEQYAQYLAGKHTLTANEVQQIAFRLAKELNHKQLYPVDRKTPFDLEPVKKFAEQNGQSETLKQAFANAETFMREGNDLQRRATVREILRHFNTQRAILMNHQIYLMTTRVGKGDEYPGVGLVAEWYKRNLLIFANIARLIDSPQERVLVIYGQGHAHLLRQFIQDSPDMELVEVSKYL